ncbi:MAG: aldo/keto reductase [Candidatus Marinimicrobia bacterium]|nr:aldo/keto reductase [Candidatus Neomarinimicrobiota bacterium]MCF7827764.1 aldo/keto reductase [Candidatus Neomarinimicrobiota bacterium]MCF7879481.1 aldo/keto reductase [Candidatus Neomarinimicrobiota bacterium]
MTKLNRREFLRKTLGGVGTLALGAAGTDILAEQKTLYADDRIILGPSDVEVSRLAIGTGTSGFGGSSEQTRDLGISGLADLLRHGYENGITFWDSADAYGSHPHLNEALDYVPREEVQILTKTHASSAREMKADLDRFRKELGTDYIDILLLHMMRDEDWDQQKQGAMEVIAKAKQDGIVSTHGVSCHTLRALKTAARSDWVEVDLARINPFGIRMDADTETVASVLEEMKRNGKGVIGMKLLGDGRLVHRIDESLRYSLTHDFVDCFTIGIEAKEELDDLIERIPKVTA